MWRRTSLTPSDVDIAELYDGFSYLTMLWLEALGLCGVGESGSFVEGGTRIALDGTLPLNTARWSAGPKWRSSPPVAATPADVCSSPRRPELEPGRITSSPDELRSTPNREVHRIEKYTEQSSPGGIRMHMDRVRSLALDLEG